MSIAYRHNLKDFPKRIQKMLSSKDYAKGSNPSVIVGYTAKYALFVHENTEQKGKGKPRPSGIGNYWDPNGQPKFLEQPARKMKKQISDKVLQVTKLTGSLEQGLFMGGLLLQRASQELVPVEYGNLKASAFTKIE